MTTLNNDKKMLITIQDIYRQAEELSKLEKVRVGGWVKDSAELAYRLEKAAPLLYSDEPISPFHLQLYDADTLTVVAPRCRCPRRRRRRGRNSRSPSRLRNPEAEQEGGLVWARPCSRHGQRASRRSARGKGGSHRAVATVHRWAEPRG